MVIITRAELRRKKHNIFLKKALSELEETTDHLNKTYSIIAHDLKGPLGSTINILNLMMDGTVEQKNWPKYIKITHKTLDQTYSLMLNLLDWARVKDNKLNFDPKETDITEIIQSTVSLHRHAITNKSIELSLNSKNDIKVYADENMLMTLLRNLLNNAIKFTPTGGKIHISVEEQKENVAIKIIDTGVGMTQKQIDNVFNINVFESSMGTHNEKGSGLGLNLVVDMVAKNNGKLEIKSQPGNGAEFTVILKKPVEN